MASLVPGYLPSAATVGRAALPYVGAVAASATPLLQLLSNATLPYLANPSKPANNPAGPMADLNVSSVVATLVAVYVGLKVLGIVRRLVWAWLVLFFRMGLLGGVLVLGLWVWARGIDDAAADVAAWFGAGDPRRAKKTGVWGVGGGGGAVGAGRGARGRWG